MSRACSRVNVLQSILAGTAVIAAVVVSQPTSAKNSKEIAQIAMATTVQINNTLSPQIGGSGVIIAKDGNTYTVLTANHVVNNINSEYNIRTSVGKDYPVTSVQSLQLSDTEPDLAVVKFQSQEEYPVAPINDSDPGVVGTDIYVSGYPLPSIAGEEREYAFTNGIIATQRKSYPQGYTMRYQALTRRGMSGGPVFDSSGRIVGIHGQGESLGTIQSESSGQSEELKTGFNAAIPISTFVAIMSKVGLNRSDLKMDNSPTETSQQPNANQEQTCYVQGLTRTEQGDLSGANDAYTTELNRNCNQALTYLNRGVVRYQMGDKPGAISDWTTALQKEPNLVEAYYNRGVTLYSLGNYAEAIADWTAALRINPNDAQTYYKRGLAHYHLRDKLGARSDYTQALRFDPSYVQAYLNRGIVLDDLGDKQGALEDYNQALKINPNYGKAYHNRGVIRYQLGDKPGAIEDLQKAAQIFFEQGDKDSYRSALDNLRQLQR